MYPILTTLASALVLTSACVARNFSDGTLKNSTTATKETATVRVDSTSVAQLIRVIGVEGNEGACVGGKPSYVFEVSPGAKRVFEIPITVKKIGLCGQARPDGMDYKHIEVSLEKGARYVIRDDVMQKDLEPVKAGFARVRLQSTSVQQLTRVIGIEKNEAACVGGNPKHLFEVQNGKQSIFDFPISVKKIGLCGQARPDGMDYKHLDVLLKDGVAYVIESDVLKEE